MPPSANTLRSAHVIGAAHPVFGVITSLSVLAT